MTWPLENPPEDIQKLVLEQQGKFKAEKGRQVSIPETIYKLLKQAYLVQVMETPKRMNEGR